MIREIVLFVFIILGVWFMLWVIVALEFKIRRDHANRDLAKDAMGR